MTLRLRLEIAGGIVLLVVALAVLFVPRVVEAAQLRQIDQELVGDIPQAFSLSRGPAPPLTGSSTQRTTPRSSSRGAEGRLGTVYIAQVSGAERTVLLPAEDGAAPALPSRTSRSPSPQGKGSSSAPTVQTVTSLHGATTWRAVLLTGGPGGGRLLLAISLQQVAATDAELRLALEGAGGAVVLVLVAVGWWLARLGLRPVAEVTAVADAITAGARDRRARVPGGGTEAAHLARAVNLMLDEEQAAEERLRAFVADASHELRTPITAVAGLLDLWRRGELAGEEERREAMRRMGQETARMAGLVEDLLLLARLDQRRPLEQVPVSLGELVDEAVAQSAVTHPSRTVVGEVAEPALALGDPTRLRQVLANLVTNALVHTPDRGPVRIRASSAAERCVLEVADAGPGMDAAQAARAFDRFWRGDPARSGPGSGLGLAIVAGIVAAHHGRVTLDTAPARGTTVRVELPLVGCHRKC